MGRGRKEEGRPRGRCRQAQGEARFEGKQGSTAAENMGAGDAGQARGRQVSEAASPLVPWAEGACPLLPSVPRSVQTLRHRPVSKPCPD